MTKSSAELGQEFEARAQEFAELVRGLDDEQWQAMCVGENWSVGTTAHHVGQSITATWQITEAILANSVPEFSREDLDAANAAHAAQFPNPDKAETLALVEDSAKEVSAAIAALDEDSLNQAAVVSAFGPEPLPVRDWIETVVIGHFGMHKPSIEAATGR